jgi:hypothetical protein
MQLALYDESLLPDPERRVSVRPRRQQPERQEGRRQEDSHRMCAACRAREARYGFRAENDDPTVDRPRTLCFECFRIEVDRRQTVAAQLARGWNAKQDDLPLTTRYDELRKRRGRAQIAARRALALR